LSARRVLQANYGRQISEILCELDLAHETVGEGGVLPLERAMAQERDKKRTRKEATRGTHAFVPELAAAAPDIEHQRELPGPVVAAMVERGFSPDAVAALAWRRRASSRPLCLGRRGNRQEGMPAKRTKTVRTATRGNGR
jgi:hypothetical protein